MDSECHISISVNLAVLIFSAIMQVVISCLLFYFFLTWIEVIQVDHYYIHIHFSYQFS